MSGEAWFTLAVVGMCLGFLARSRVAPDVVLSAGLALLLLGDIITPTEALVGLANEGMVTVGVLYIVVSGLRETGGMQWVVQRVLGRPRSLIGAQLRLMAPVSALSAFVNNTPVVAMFIPALHDWARRNHLSLSALMIPLSYAAIAGGTCTLIGTSTNLVVNGLLQTQTDLPPLHLFDIAWVGVPTSLLVIAYVLAVSRWLLPERRPAATQFADAREYTLEMLVEPDSPLVGKSIEDAGLRQLPGTFLVEIDREGRILPAVGPQERLAANDRLVFAGVLESVVDLQRVRGLKPATDQVFKLDAPRRQRCLVEAVVSNTCPLVGRSIREGRFRNLYNAVVIAVSRNGERLNRKIGDIVLRPGDTLLLEAGENFAEQQHNSRDFYLVSRLNDSRPLRHERAAVAVGILVLMVALASFGWLPMLEAALLAAGLMILTRCTSSHIARRDVDWQVLVVIAASFGIGAALQKTGAAAVLAHNLIALANGNPRVALLLVYVATAICTEVVTNNTAAVLIFPIALATAHDLDVNFMPFAITIMMAASASFATPIGYQTNLMVYGPGGYRFGDYLRMGIPLALLTCTLTVSLVPLFWPL